MSEKEATRKQEKRDVKKEWELLAKKNDKLAKQYKVVVLAEKHSRVASKVLRDSDFMLGGDWEAIARAVANLRNSWLGLPDLGNKALKGFFKVNNTFPVLDIDGYIKREAEKIANNATPILYVWEVCVMLLAPPYSMDDRKYLALAIFNAIERWGMKVSAYPDAIEHPAFFDNLSYDEKTRAKIHVDELEKYVLSGIISADVVPLVVLWREYIAKHENQLILPQVQESRVVCINDDSLRYLERAKYLWDNWETYDKKHKLEKRGKTKIYLYVGLEFNKSESHVREAIKQDFEKYI